MITIIAGDSSQERKREGEGKQSIKSLELSP